jgi:hypothetical protein
MTQTDKTRLIVAVAVNIAVAQMLASWLGFPRWTGTLAAGGAMAAASMPNKLAKPVLQVVEVAVLPGSVAAKAIYPAGAELACCPSCEAGKPCEGN